MIAVRDADVERDALTIMDAMRDFATRITMQDMIATGDDLVSAVGAVVTADHTEILIAGEDRAEGCLGIAYVPFLWNAAITLAEEIFWWTAKDAPRGTGHALFHEAMDRIDARGAVPVFRTLTTSPAGVDRLYRKNGLTPIETVYMGTA